MGSVHLKYGGKPGLARAVLALLAVLGLAAGCSPASGTPKQSLATATPAVVALETAPAATTLAPSATPSLAPSPMPSATPQPSVTAPLPTAAVTRTASVTAVPPSRTPTARPSPTRTVAPTRRPATATRLPAPAATRPSGSAQEAFIARVAPLAQAEQADSGVPASFSIALAAYETGWGQSQLMRDHNNYHMVSCSSPSEGLPCERYGDGMWNAYSSPAQAFLWHGRWMRAKAGFAEGFKHTDGVAAFTRLVVTCYISCAGQFPQRFYDGLMAIVDQYDLRRFDAKPGGS